MTRTSIVVPALLAALTGTACLSLRATGTEPLQAHRRGAGLSVAIGLDGSPRYIVAQGRWNGPGPTLFRLNALTGAIQWRTRPPGDLPGDLAVVGAVVVANGDGGQALFGVSVDTGRVLWVLDSSNAAWREGCGKSFGVETDGRRVYLPTQLNHGVAAIDPTSGTVLWSHTDPFEGSEAGAHFVDLLAPRGDRLLTNYGWLVAATGRVLLRFRGEIEPDIGTSRTQMFGLPFAGISDDGEVLVMRAGNLIQRIDTDTLEWRWTARLDPHLDRVGVLADAHGVFVSATRRGEPTRETLVMFDAAIGQQRWSIATAGSPQGTWLAVDDEHAYVMDAGRVGARSRLTTYSRDGKPIWAYDTGSVVQGVVAAAPFVFARIDDAVHALDRRTGKLQWRVDLR